MNVRTARRTLVGMTLLLGACIDSHVPTFPAEALEPYAAPAHYADWWRLMEQCAGRRAPLDRVQWFRPTTGFIELDGNVYGGYWWSRGNRIALHRPDDGVDVRHEMLHAILRDGGHPRTYFADRCAPMLGYSRIDSLPPGPAPTFHAPSSTLAVAIERLTRSLSMRENGGNLTFLVTATNRADVPRWVQLESWQIAAVRAQPDGYGAIGNGTATHFFRANERRSLVIDLEVPRPGVYRVRGYYAGVWSAETVIEVTP